MAHTIDYLLNLPVERVFTLILLSCVAAICMSAVFRNMGKHGVVALFVIVMAVAVIDSLMGGVIRDTLKGVR